MCYILGRKESTASHDDLLCVNNKLKRYSSFSFDFILPVSAYPRLKAIPPLPPPGSVVQQIKIYTALD